MSEIWDDEWQDDPEDGESPADRILLQDDYLHRIWEQNDRNGFRGEPEHLTPAHEPAIAPRSASTVVEADAPAGGQGGHSTAAGARDGAPSAKLSKNAKRAARAALLGISTEQLRSLRRWESEVSAACRSLPKSKREVAAAVAHKMTVERLLRFRALLNQSDVKPEPLELRWLANLVDRVPSKGTEPTTTARVPKKKGNRPRPASGPTPAEAAGLARLGSRTQLGGSEKPGKRKFVVADHSRAIHEKSDCHGLWGSRPAGSTAPRTFLVMLKDPFCAGKAACKKCVSASYGARMNSVIRNIHGVPGRSAKKKRR